MAARPFRAPDAGDPFLIPFVLTPVAAAGTSLTLGTLPLFLALQVQTPPSGWRLWLATATDIAILIIALALLIAALVAVVIALLLLKLFRKVQPLIRQVQGHIDPVMGHVKDVGENVNYMSSAIRADVQQVTELVDSTRRRLNHTAESAEVRIREFNALLGVMQEEAERLFIDTASTVRGVRAGTERYRRVRDGGSATETGSEPAPERGGRVDPGAALDIRVEPKQ
jgi:hypothetical protein